MTLKEIRRALVNGKITCSEANQYVVDLLVDVDRKSMSDEELENLIHICNDIYTYSDEGLVILSDRSYDLMMHDWMERGHERIIYPDDLKIKTWNIVKHKHPGLVGSLDKCYDPIGFLCWATGFKGKELTDYQKSTGTYPRPQYLDYILAPKYDGISGSIELNDGKIDLGLTRRDGYAGQDITKVITESCGRIEPGFATGFEISYYGLYKEDLPVTSLDGYYKVEILMSTGNFLALQKEMTEQGKKPYANRRSAVSGIVNAPKNLEYARYLSIVPLLYESKRNGNVYYAPPGSQRVKFFKTDSASRLFEEADVFLRQIRNPDSNFPFRLDGVVAYPVDPVDFNPSDYMDKAMAYKINTNIAPGKIEYAYVSVGLMGKAIPMLHIKPTEVNETMVEDVSLGSWDKLMNMKLHEGEVVEIFSAGDVIPQARLPEERPKCKTPFIELKTVCPYCGEKLTRIKNEYWCVNEDCDHLAIGKIVNFVIKMGGQNIGEGRITDLYEKGLCRSIYDLFVNTVNLLRVEKFPGWDKTSIDNLEAELQRIQTTPTEVSKFVGSLGIKLIGRRKCRGIFKNITIKEVFDESQLPLEIRLCGYDKVGGTTAKNFANYFTEHKKEIKQLMKLFNLIPDKQYKGSICFTGFRDDELADRFEDLGYEVTDSINDDCVALLAASTNSTSGKAKNARKKGISIVHRSHVDELLEALKN